MAKSSKKKDKKAKVHKDLEGLDLRINDLGEVESTIDIDELNKFLDKNVPDKKIDENVKRVTDSEDDEEDSES